MTIPVWFVWTMVGIQWLNAIAIILLVGEPRKSYTSASAVGALIGAGAWTFLALMWAGAL
jgi:hypothetical protein